MRSARVIFSVVVALFILGSTFAMTQVPEMPDYSGWANMSYPMKAVYNSKPVVLNNTDYARADNARMAEELVSVLHDENGRPWLALYQYVQHTPDHQNEKPQVNLFEMVNGQWVHVRDLSGLTGQEFNNFLRDRYNLVF